MLLMRAQHSRAEAQALLAVLGTWETAMVSAGPGAVFPIKGQGMLESPRASPAPSSMVPWLQEERLTH